MSKKILAMLMAVAMAFSLLPVTAFATGRPSATTTEDVVYGHYTNTGEWKSGELENAIPGSLKDTVTTVDKTAKKVDGQDNQYEVTLKVEMKHKTEEVQPGAAATVLVIDKSGSMNYCTDPTHTHTKDRYGNECGTWPGRTSRLSVAKTAAINFLKSYSGFSNSDFNENGSLKNNVSGKNLRRYVSLVTFNDSASLQTWGKWNNQESWIDVSTKAGYQKLVNAINEIGAGGGTNLDAALRLAKTQSDKITQIGKSKRNVIALTDGVPTFYGNNVKKHGSYGCPDTNVATTTSATTLKANVNAVYTVCFGAANDRCWTKGSVHVDHIILEDEKHTTDGPTVGNFLKDSIATQPTKDSDKQYAYNADDANGLYEAFAAITQTITDGLNEGVVTDGLPEGVSCTDNTFGEDKTLTWNLKSNEATVTSDGEYNVYTYTKTYKVNVDPATVSTVKVGEVNYAPLNTPTTLTVQHNGSPVEIHFPIPAIRINITQATVTFKVKNGTWSDGETGDKTTTVTMINGKGTLPTSAVPTEMKANANYEGGAWDTTPNTETNGITGDATYTYSFAPTSGTATVTFKVKNGTWSDGTNADKTVRVNLSAGKGTLSNSAVPTEMKANANYEGGAWDTTPNTETNGITGDVTYTYSFVPKKVWDTKQLKTATKLNTSDWTTTVKLTLPTVNGNKEGTPETEVQPDPITAISKGSYVIDKIGEQFTFMDGLSLKKNNAEIPKKKIGDTYYFGENATEQRYLYKLTYTERNGEEAAQFKWEINENIPAETTVTLSYKLKLDNPNKTAGTHGVKDLDGDGKVDDTNAAFTENDKKNALYTNKSAVLYKDANTKLAEFPKPSVSYTVSSGNSGSHSGSSRPSLNTKDHYGYIIGYPVDYYTGQPTTDQTKKPVRPEGKITRAEVATIYFRMLTDESRTKFWSQSSGYSDVKAGDWFNNAVSTLSKAGIIAGYEDGSFRPNGYITRAEFATIAARFFDVTYNGKDLFPDISGHWAKDYINQAANKGFVNGYEDGTFKPDRNITRAEAVTLVNRTLDRHPDKNHFTKDMLVWPDNMDQTKWYYADMQEATNSHTYQMKENSDKTKYENWTKTLPIRNWEALEKAWSNANSSQGNGNVV